mmetsp:Transcript_62048/g.140355  ORF Transcript_62048/g.140355 Transcript_62048/m.140355 type:complete len:875 (+) Transcript_62048:119-2743(+)|eukprot:CAMPEP_0172590270 /NCGR_PEP_ID=MMETSP1068-20121228/8719_1 /TAXON_ID=35684 /ORGANISM="Pseudopedinella elastica, Strain CCMP716" /LENGTH=874 /DNA_ID=CAMNT_0013386033 /DNA_START=127 /DNA_END=2751 /DNA_ORIENTATION=-
MVVLQSRVHHQGSLRARKIVRQASASPIQRSESNVCRGSRTPFNECHGFEWSRELWAEAARKIGRTTTLAFVVYLAIAVWGCHMDGMQGADIPYFLSATLTTVGLGDVSPKRPVTCLAAVVMLPLGLVLVTFQLYVLNTIALAKTTIPFSDILLGAKSDETGEATLPLQDAKESKKKAGKLGWALCCDFGQTDFGKVLLLFRDYVLVLTLGAAFFKCDNYFKFIDKEREAQLENDEKMTWVDCYYFATVVSTTVGYGHKITPQTNLAKIYYTIYFWISTAMIGTILGGLSSLLVEYKRSKIQDTIIGSVQEIYKCDLHKRGSLLQSDYLLFKLLQMQELDVGMLSRLTERFSELDEGRHGYLIIGVEIPSATMVKHMEAEAHKGKYKTLEEAWTEMRPTLVREHSPGRLARAESLLDSGLSGGDKPRRLHECAEFTWSRDLWHTAAKDIAKATTFVFIIYLVLGYYCMCYLDSSIADKGWERTVGWYTLSSTMSTVGLGDYAPEDQLTRAVGILVIPLGLVVVAMVVAAIHARKLSLPPRIKTLHASTELANLFHKLDRNRDGVLTKEEIVNSAELLDVTPKEAEELFDSLDLDKSGALEFKAPKTKTNFGQTVTGRFLKLLFVLYGTISAGAVVFRLYGSGITGIPIGGPEEKLSWVDCFYFGTVIATTIGYGDITPSTKVGRLFLTFYFLASTVIAASVLGNLAELFVDDVVGERINSEIMDSVTWVHRADLSDPPLGRISEADYCLFKLLQMKKVNEEVMIRLIDQFFELDKENTGSLVVGVEVPDKEQVDELARLVEGLAPDTYHAMEQAWAKHLSGEYRLHKVLKLKGRNRMTAESKDNGGEFGVNVSPLLWTGQGALREWYSSPGTTI